MQTTYGTKITPVVFWYRYEDRLTTGGVRVLCWRLELLKKTPRGVVVRPPGGGRRFIADHWTKKFACPTRELALESFVARKMRQASIYEARAKDARRAAADAVTLTLTPKPGLFGGVEFLP